MQVQCWRVGIGMNLDDHAANPQEHSQQGEQMSPEPFKSAPMEFPSVLVYTYIQLMGSHSGCF